MALFKGLLVSAVLSRGDRMIATARSIEKIHDSFPGSPNLCLLPLDIHQGSGGRGGGQMGSIDALVNNAGVGFPGLLEEGG